VSLGHSAPTTRQASPEKDSRPLIWSSTREIGATGGLSQLLPLHGVSGQDNRCGFGQF